MSCCGGGGAMKQLEKMRVLKETTPFGAYLDEGELEHMATLCDISKFDANAELPESPFYCVMSGQVQVIENGEVLCTRFSGSFFTRRAGLVRGLNQPVRNTRKSIMFGNSGQ
eukprot:115702-Prymnesium_polylepis.1